MTEKGGAWLISLSPEGITRIEPKEPGVISDAVYEQVVAELDEVRHAWQANLRDTALAEERAERAEAELQEALKELEIRKRELITCREAKLAAEVQIQKLTNMGKEI